MRANEKMASITHSEWEIELDTLGVNSDISEYVRMLEKAPPSSHSLQALANYVQAKLS
jgi:hypothetical protein